MARTGRRNPPSDADRDRKLTPAARRALKEAEERRKKADPVNRRNDGEVGGRDGLEPTRYGDWEKNGLISDF